jgi:hypothetical protein
MENYFFSIEIRDLNFDYDRYYLSLEDIDNNKLLFNDNQNYKKIEDEELPNDAISAVTSYTVVPKFSIDKIATPILYKILNIDYNIINEKEKNVYLKNKKDDEKNENIIEEEEKQKELTINVISFTKKETICSFQVRYPLFPIYYNFLGKTPGNFKLLQFPCVLLQCNTGFFALKKIITVQKNNKYIEEEINLAIQINKDSFFESLFINRQKPIPTRKKNNVDFEKIMQSRASYNSTLSNLKEKQEELINKKKELSKLIEERKKVLEKRQQILSCHKFIESNKGSWNRLITLKEILTKINTYTTEVITIKEKKISNCDKEIQKYKEEVKNKKKKDIPTLHRINDGLQVTNYLLYKYAMNEICYYFFNKNINTYNFPDLNLSKKMVEEFYNTKQKEISAMFGNIILLLNYISKKFDIILPYSLYYNGSKSMVFTSMGGKNTAIDMYMKENEKNVIGNKNENDIQIKLEVLLQMIYGVIMFFYSRKICSKKFNMENIINNKKNKNNVYMHFMKLNELFKDILDK